MTDNNSANQSSVGTLTRTVKRSEIVEHLTNFRRDVDRYIHALPGILLGVPCAHVIQAAMTLVWHLDQTKAALIDAMVREGLNPVGEGDLAVGHHRSQSNSNDANRVPYHAYTGHAGHHVFTGHSHVTHAHTVPTTATTPLTTQAVQYHNFETARPQPVGRAAAPTPAARLYLSTGEQVVPDRPVRSVEVSQHYADPYANRYPGFRDPSVSQVTDISRYQSTPVPSQSNQYYPMDSSTSQTNSAAPSVAGQYQNNAQ